MGLKDFKRHSAAVGRTRRWQVLRAQILERDGYQCRECGERRRLEVDHIEPVRDAPDRAFDRANLQTLCVGCHARKTRIEIGLGRPDPKRDAWKQLLRNMQRNLSSNGVNDA